jgi:hypothetical protein
VQSDSVWFGLSFIQRNTNWSSLLDGSLDEHVEEVHEVDGVLERCEWIQRLRHVWREDHGDVARAHLVGLLLLGDVGHEVDGPVQQAALGGCSLAQRWAQSSSDWHRVTSPAGSESSTPPGSSRNHACICSVGISNFSLDHQNKSAIRNN